VLEHPPRDVVLGCDHDVDELPGLLAAASLELVEVNPILDHENATTKLAVELAAIALGARIL
jgi:arginase family enzyme